MVVAYKEMDRQKNLTEKQRLLSADEPAPNSLSTHVRTCMFSNLILSEHSTFRISLHIEDLHLQTYKKARKKAHEEPRGLIHCRTLWRAATSVQKLAHFRPHFHKLAR